jgi:hypothetical protein
MRYPRTVDDRLHSWSRQVKKEGSYISKLLYTRSDEPCTCRSAMARDHTANLVPLRRRSTSACMRTRSSQFWSRGIGNSKNSSEFSRRDWTHNLPMTSHRRILASHYKVTTTVRVFLSSFSYHSRSWFKPTSTPDCDDRSIICHNPYPLYFAITYSRFDRISLAQ